MKNSLYVALGALVLMAAAGSAVASEGQEITATIPFQFSVNESVLPAGEYAFFYTDPAVHTAMTVRALKAEGEDTFFVEPTQAATPPTATELVFDEIGGRRYLRQLWVVDENEGREVVLSTAEKLAESAGHHATQTRVPARQTVHTAKKG